VSRVIFAVEDTFFRKGAVMAYYKVRIEVWCDWNPGESDLEEIVQNTSTGEAICTKQEVIAVTIVRKTSTMMKP